MNFREYYDTESVNDSLDIRIYEYNDHEPEFSVYSKFANAESFIKLLEPQYSSNNKYKLSDKEIDDIIEYLNKEIHYAGVSDTITMWDLLCSSWDSISAIDNTKKIYNTERSLPNYNLLKEK